MSDPSETQSKDLAPGQWIMHRNGIVARLSSRKASDDGWWLRDGGGIADTVLDGPDWMLLGPPRCTNCDTLRARADTAEAERETAHEMIERVMTDHWDMAACRCWFCRMGRDLGCRPRRNRRGHGEWGKQITDAEFDAWSTTRTLEDNDGALIEDGAT